MHSTVGKHHFKLGVRSEHLDMMGYVFCHSVRPVLIANSTWSLQLEEAWMAAFRFQFSKIK